MILIDANVFMYAAGRESPQQLPCQRLLEKLVRGEGPAVCTDAEVLQEILHRYRSIKAPAFGFEVFDVVTHLGLPILPITDRVMEEARVLLEAHPGLSTRDGVHLGVMRVYDMDTVFSYDRDLSAVRWVKRVEP